MKKLITIILSFICYGGSICYAQDIVKKLKEEEDGFKWYELTKDYTYYGAEDINGKTLIPLSENFDIIWYKEGYFDCKRTMKKGKKIKTLSLAIYDKYGKLIIAPGRYDYAHIRSTKSIPQYFDVKISKKKVGICDLNGNEIIAPGRYDQVYLETYYGIPEYYKVIKNKKDGICDLNGVEIISPQYKSIITSYSDKGLAFKTQIKKKFVTIKTIPIDLSKYYKRGLQLEEQGEISDASHVFETCALYGKYSPAQVKFGEILLYHKRKLSIDQNYELQEAFRWFQKAAVQGDENGQYYMGYCYENGKGTSQSMVRAKEWYEKAANQGNTYAKERLLAINPTDANAQNDLGVKSYNENKDYSEAIKWFKKAAAQGHKYAEYNMGLCYEYGNGTTKNKQEALAWYKKAKNHGHPDAAKRIAELTKPATPPQTYTAQTQTTKPQRQTSQVQKYHDALAFELLDDGMKECKLKHEYYGGSAVIVDLSFLMNYSEIYKFSRDGQLTNAAEIGITNIQRNKEGCIISYKKDDCTYKLEYESLPTKTGINSIRLKRLSWESPEPCEYRYVKLDDAELMSGIWEERHYYKNGKLEEKEKIEQRWDENYSKNHKKYFYFFPASEKKATEKNIKECVTREPIYWK